MARTIFTDVFVIIFFAVQIMFVSLHYLTKCKVEGKARFTVR